MGSGSDLHVFHQYNNSHSPHSHPIILLQVLDLTAQPLLPSLSVKLYFLSISSVILNSSINSLTINQLPDGLIPWLVKQCTQQSLCSRLFIHCKNDKLFIFFLTFHQFKRQWHLLLIPYLLACQANELPLFGNLLGFSSSLAILISSCSVLFFLWVTSCKLAAVVFVSRYRCALLVIKDNNT